MDECIDVKYYQWLTEWAKTLCSPYGGPYDELMHDLYICPFEAYVAGDENRIEDVYRLHELFASENSIPKNEVDRAVSNLPVSLLEVMLAMAYRCENDIMGDGETDRLSAWFFDMLCCAELDDMTDDNYDPVYVEFVLERIIGRTYEKNGRGGLFIVNRPTRDLRKTELWYQMCWHLSELVEDDT